LLEVNQNLIPKFQDLELASDGDPTDPSTQIKLASVFYEHIADLKYGL
jgi:hypothetical protein